MKRKDTPDQARKRRREFSARGSNCPICKQDFRTCPHTLDQVHARLDDNITSAVVRNTKPK